MFMKYEDMTKAQLIEELRKLKNEQFEKSGEIFFAFVYDDSGEKYVIENLLDRHNSFYSILEDAKRNEYQFSIDFVYWDGESFVSPIGGHEWDCAIRIPTKLLSDYFMKSGEV